MDRAKRALFVTLSILFILPFVLDNYFLHIFIIIFLGVIYGQSWNLLGGFTGQISFGHALFFGIGSYGTMRFLTSEKLLDFGGLFGHQIDPIIAIIFGAIITMLVTLLLGMIIFRLKGPYLGLGTLALAEIGFVIAMNWKSVTNGGEGILLLDTFSLGPFELAGKTSFYYLVMFIAIFSIWLVSKIMKSKFGYYLLAIREDDDAAEAIGVPTQKYKTYSLTVSAFLASLAGGFHALYVGFVSPEGAFSVHLSVEMIFITIVGGVGTIFGPVAGAVVLTVLGELFKSYFDNAYLVVYGLLLIFVILYMPEGIYGYIKKLFKIEKEGDSPCQNYESQI